EVSGGRRLLLRAQRTDVRSQDLLVDPAPEQVASQREAAVAGTAAGHEALGVGVVVGQAQLLEARHQLISRRGGHAAPRQLLPELVHRVGLPAQQVQKVVPCAVAIQQPGGSPPGAGAGTLSRARPGTGHLSTLTGSRRAARLAGNTPAMTLV